MDLHKWSARSNMSHYHCTKKYIFTYAQYKNISHPPPWEGTKEWHTVRQRQKWWLLMILLGPALRQRLCVRQREGGSVCGSAAEADGSSVIRERCSRSLLRRCALFTHIQTSIRYPNWNSDLVLRIAAHLSFRDTLRKDALWDAEMFLHKTHLSEQDLVNRLDQLNILLLAILP